MDDIELEKLAQQFEIKHTNKNEILNQMLEIFAVENKFNF